MAPDHLGRAFNMLAVLLLVASVTFKPAAGLTPELCDKMCAVAPVFCWVCGESSSKDSGDLKDVDGLEGLDLAEEDVDPGFGYHPLQNFRQQKVIGGYPISYGNEMNHVVGLGRTVGNRRSNFCGGTLITDKHVVTAAHCVFNRDIQEFVVFAGDFDRLDVDPGEVAVAVAKKHIHPEYKVRNHHHDLAVLELADSLKFSKYVSPALLAAKHFRYWDGTVFEVAGWGSTSKTFGPISRLLHKTKVTYVDVLSCQDEYRQYYGRVGTSRKPDIIQGMVCAGDRSTDSCLGDSGGPMVGYYGLQDFIDYDWWKNFAKKNGTQEPPQEADDDPGSGDGDSTAFTKDNEATAKVKRDLTSSGSKEDEGGFGDPHEFLQTDLDKRTRVRSSNMVKFLTDLRTRLNQRANDEADAWLRRGGQDLEARDSQEEEEEEKEQAPLGETSRFLFPDGVPSKGTKVAIQSMINAGIEASILNALAHFQALQQQNNLHIQHQLEAHHLTKDSEDVHDLFGEGVKKQVKRYPVKIPMTVDQARGSAIPTLTGIVSWGHGCAMLPGVYTDVRVYRDWIVEVIGGDPQIEIVFEDDFDL